MRIFVRGSGTEDVIRIHLEWKNEENTRLADNRELKHLMDIIDKYLETHKVLNWFYWIFVLNCIL